MANCRELTAAGVSARDEVIAPTAEITGSQMTVLREEYISTRPARAQAALACAVATYPQEFALIGRFTPDMDMVFVGAGIGHRF